MVNLAAEDLEAFLRRQDEEDLVSLLLELATEQEAVQARLARMQLACQPERLATFFRKRLAGWRRSTKYYDYAQADAFGRAIEGWMDQVTHELAPTDPSAALALFETCIEADQTWFEHADDSNGVIGDVVRAACRHWLQAAARCGTPHVDWPERILALYQADQYGARDELLRCACQLLDEPAQRGLVANLESRLSEALETSPRSRNLPPEIFQLLGALSLLADSLRDPDIRVRATLRCDPNPSSAQREGFARAYLAADRAADALNWLQDEEGHLDDSRHDLLANALEQLGRFEESLPIRQGTFERTLSHFDFLRWFEHLPQAGRPAAVARARQIALLHDEVVDAATLLIKLGDAAAAEAKLLANFRRVDGNRYATLIPLAEALRVQEFPHGETIVYRALLKSILDRAYSRAYGHAARYWGRLGEIAAAGISLEPLSSHEEFQVKIRARHGRKAAFWSFVNGTRRDRHDED